MRKIISTTIFTVAIIFGLGVGYGAVKTTGIVYGAASAYVAEVTTNLNFSKENKGGPAPEPIIESELNETKEPVDSRIFYITNQDKKPKVTALSFLVADLESGKVLLSKNINQQLPIASVTKLMTAVVADETLGLDYKTTVDSTAINTYGTQGNLKKGEKYSVSELLYPLLLESSNDAAEALARAKNRPSFITDMNAKAKSIGLLNTEYEDASGLSPNNKSSVTDLFRLVQYIHEYRSYLFEITIEKKKDLGNKTWFSNSRFRSDDAYVGGKNGFTDEALKTQIALFEQEFGGEKRTVAYIILRSSDVASDIGVLRNFIEKNVQYK